MGTWGELRLKYLSATGRRDSAEQEAWDHLSEGYRRVASRLDLPELRVADAIVTVAEDDYYFNHDCQAYAIRSIFNSTDGTPMHEESGNMSGYNRFLEPSATGTPMPPKGTPTRYFRAGNNIYFRDRADGEKKFVIQFDIQVPAVTVSDINNHPIVPDQYHLAVVYAAARSYFLVHPTENTAPDGQQRPSESLSAAVDEILTRSKDPVEIESRGERLTMRVAGYRYTPRSHGRRWR